MPGFVFPTWIIACIPITRSLGFEILENTTSPRESPLVFLKAPGIDRETELYSFPESGQMGVQQGPVNLNFQVENLERLWPN